MPKVFRRSRAYASTEFLARPFSTVAIARKASMEGLSESFAWFISGRQILPEKFAHRFDRTGVGCFVAVSDR